MSDIQEITPNKLPREIEKLLTPIKESKFEAFTIMFLGSALKRLNITPETQPELMRQVGVVLKQGAPNYWPATIKEVDGRLHNHDYMAHQYLKQAVNDLLVFQQAAVDVKPYAQKLIDIVNGLKKDDMDHLTKMWLVKPFAEMEMLKEMVAVPETKTKSSAKAA